MSRVAFNTEQRSASEIMRWYSDMTLALVRLRRDILEAIDEQREVPDSFLGMGRTDVNTHFRAAQGELERVVCLLLLAAAEAVLRVDYLKRVYLKLKDQASRACRELHKLKEERVSLDEDLLELWREHAPASSAAIGELRGALHLRHWLAHGRYWKAQLGRKEYDAQAIFNIVSEVFQRLPDVEGWPGGTAPTSS